ncbi:MAG: hypothetical protein AAF242_15275 [Bacteroidota bacterium]
MFLVIFSVLSLTACDQPITQNFPIVYKKGSFQSGPPELFVLSELGFVPIEKGLPANSVSWTYNYPEFEIESFSFYSELDVELYHSLSGGEYLQMKYASYQEGMELWMPHNTDEIIILDGQLGKEILQRPFLSVRKLHDEEWPNTFLSFDLAFESNPEVSIFEGVLYGFEVNLGDTIVIQRNALEYNLL